MKPSINPLVHHARVRFPDEHIADVDAAVTDALNHSGIRVPRGRVAVAVGSRGIAGIAAMVRRCVAWLRARGAEPFIVPAMGSHGGASADGQAAVLASYGITEPAMGAPVLSSMETVSLEAGDLEVPLFMDRYAYESDGVLLVNRVKPHTDFHGFPESGLFKMSVIGLGKHDQALAVHSLGIHGLKDLILPAARRILRSGKIIGGVAIVENAYDLPQTIRAVTPDSMEHLERELLEMAGSVMPGLPLDDVDLLIVDEMGKDVSGTGLDTNVIGRLKIRGETEPAAPRVRSLLVTRLTPASHGNAIGIGLADVITRELYDAIDFAATYENGLTSSFSERIKVPYVAESHDDALRVALRFAGLGSDLERAARIGRIARIRNTLALSSLLVSAPAARDLAERADVEVAKQGEPLFGPDGSLAPWRDQSIND